MFIRKQGFFRAAARLTWSPVSDDDALGSAGVREPRLTVVHNHRSMHEKRSFAEDRSLADSPLYRVFFFNQTAAEII